jgi:hypothetical protein
MTTSAAARSGTRSGADGSHPVGGPEYLRQQVELTDEEPAELDAVPA